MWILVILPGVVFPIKVLVVGVPVSVVACVTGVDSVTVPSVLFKSNIPADVGVI
jgi:hypothetical protein